MFAASMGSIAKHGLTVFGSFIFHFFSGHLSIRCLFNVYSMSDGKQAESEPLLVVDRV